VLSTLQNVIFALNTVVGDNAGGSECLEGLTGRFDTPDRFLRMPHKPEKPDY
jgi:hypothetical protein